MNCIGRVCICACVSVFPIFSRNFDEAMRSMCRLPHDGKSCRNMCFSFLDWNLSDYGLIVAMVVVVVFTVVVFVHLKWSKTSYLTLSASNISMHAIKIVQCVMMNKSTHILRPGSVAWRHNDTCLLHHHKTRHVHSHPSMWTFAARLGYCWYSPFSFRSAMTHIYLQIQLRCVAFPPNSIWIFATLSWPKLIYIHFDSLTTLHSCQFHFSITPQPRTFCDFSWPKISQKLTDFDEISRVLRLNSMRYINDGQQLQQRR